MDLKKAVRKMFSADEDERAVSPVIGVILMVAITVILAAVIASFVLNLGSSQEAAPQASFSANYEPSNSSQGALTISHDGGDPIRQDELYIRGSSMNFDAGVSSQTWRDLIDNDGNIEGTTSGTTSGVTAVVAADELEISNANNDYELSVVWQSVSTDSSTTLFEDSGPQA